MLKRFVRLFGGDPNKRAIEQYAEIVDQVNALEPAFEKLSSPELRAKTDEFKARLANGETLDDLLPEAFAAVREVSKRTIGLRHYDVQIIGGIVLHRGIIAEMRTGEGKTLVATLPLYLNALSGRGTHLITVNDYLARRDARWMAPIFTALGLNVGVLQMASRTENGRKAFVIDLQKESPHEDQHQLQIVPRREAYEADITYGTNSEFGFDYLRDNMTLSIDDRVQRGHYYAIIDEVDNVLIDEARTPLIISGPASEDTEWYVRMAQVVRGLRPEDFEINEQDRNITLTELGEAHVEELLDMPLRDPERPEDVTPEQARLLGYLEQALRAQYLFRKNKDYMVQGSGRMGKVVIIDEFTGRLMPGRRWSDGLHQAVEAKEGVPVQPENVTYATITIQNYFRMYDKLAGMTGTALTEAEEFSKIYNLEVLAIPTNLEYQALQPDTPLVEQEDRDQQGYKYIYYTNQDDPERSPRFWKRKDYPDVVFMTEEAKFRALVQEILRNYAMGRPALVGTTSVELSERLSDRLRAEPLRRLAQVLLLRATWFKANNREEDGRVVQELQHLNQPLENLQQSELRSMARNLDASANPEDPDNVAVLAELLDLGPEHHERLLAALKAGISHEVLNARKHTEESQIIAGAGSFGAVTIATNMAGRGVDIKLGGELAEEINAAVNRVLNRATDANPYEMSLEQRRQALLKLDPSEYGIYDTEIKYFLEYIEDMRRVKEVGGLHVIGSERHEARRIDNQLRGRAARQGDPGSSRFYLSLEDELMRRFGGQQANDLMQRLKVDEALPMEVGLVGRLIEQSQSRVEGSNFDVRKHLLEYDDVLNTQRSTIYSQRNRIFTKDDLSEDVTDMLRVEVKDRVPKALDDEEGPWKLLAWLEQVQPSITLGSNILPSYTIRILAEEVLDETDGSDAALISALVEVAQGALEAEDLHLLRAVDSLLEQVRSREEDMLEERREAVQTFFEGLRFADETDIRQPRELLEELSALTRVQLRLTTEQQRQLRSDPGAVQPLVLDQVEQAVTQQTVIRLVGAVERRVNESLDVSPAQLPAGDWNALTNEVINLTQRILTRRRERLLGSQSEGMLAKELQTTLNREPRPLSDKDQQALRQAVAEALEAENASQQTVLAALSSALSRLSVSLPEEDKETVTQQLELALPDIAPRQPDADQVMETLDQALQEAAQRAVERRLFKLLLMMPQGTQTAYDRKTHRRVVQRTIRLNYIFYAARLHDNLPPEEVTEDVLSHLESAQAAIRDAWGRVEWKRLANLPLAELPESTRTALEKALRPQGVERCADHPLQDCPPELRAIIIDDLGRQALTEIYRQLLLGVITELWVDYLTEMEALRVSIGLEAYGQRDPLVQYKSKAFELFKTLLSNMRLGVVNRMFTYRPRNMARVQSETRRDQDGGEQTAEQQDETQASPEQVASQSQAAAEDSSSGSGKSSRRRRRKR